MSCVFCAIVAGQAPAIRIYEDDGYLAILDIRPFTRGHTLVIPKQHTVDLTDTPPETLADLVTIGQRIAKAARATKLADATNIVINDGNRDAMLAEAHMVCNGLDKHYKTSTLAMKLVGMSSTLSCCTLDQVTYCPT